MIGFSLKYKIQVDFLFLLIIKAETSIGYIGYRLNWPSNHCSFSAISSIENPEWHDRSCTFFKHSNNQLLLCYMNWALKDLLQTTVLKGLPGDVFSLLPQKRSASNPVLHTKSDWAYLSTLISVDLQIDT